MKIIILSRSQDAYFNTRIVQETQGRGFKADVIDPRECALHYDRILYRGMHLTDVDLCLLRTPPYREEKDYFHLAASILETSGVKVVNSVTAVEVSGNKFRTNAALSKEGIPVLPAMAVRTGEHLEAAVELTGGFPVMLKTLFGTRGIGVIYCPCLETLRAAAETMWAYHANVFVEKFAAKSEGATLRVLVCGGKVLGAVRNEATMVPTASRRREGENISPPPLQKERPPLSSQIHTQEKNSTEACLRSNYSRGGNISLQSITDEQSNLALAACKTIGLQLAGVDLIEDDFGTKVLEINSSPGIKGFEKATGRNIAGEILEILQS